jgi:hypothetical protein
MNPFFPSAAEAPDKLFRLKILAQRDDKGDENPNRGVTL